MAGHTLSEDVGRVAAIPVQPRRCHAGDDYDVRGFEMIVALFRSRMRDGADVEDYKKLSTEMVELVSSLPGFISYELWRGKDGEALTIANFESEEAVSAWRREAEHRAAQQRGREEFYETYSVQVCTTSWEYEWEAGTGN